MRFFLPINRMNARTHTCGELTLSNVDESVSLNGWVNAVRFHGQVVFVDLRDRYGKTQIVYNQEDFSGDFSAIKKLSMEDAVSYTHLTLPTNREV